MSIVKISPEFKTPEERNFVALAIGLTLIFAGYLSFIPPLVVYFGLPDKLSDSSKLILRQFINFMADVAIIIWLLTVSVIGIPLVAIVMVVALIFVIINLIAVLNNSEVSIPVLFEILKDSSVINKAQSDNNEQ